MTVRLQFRVALKNVIDDLWDGVQDYLGLPASLPSNPIVVIPSGLSFDLSTDFRLSAFNATGWRFKFAGGDYDIAFPAWVVAISEFQPLGIMALQKVKFKNSENWYYERNGYSHQLGTAYAPDEYYDGGDLMIDGTVFTVVVGILYALKELGLQKIADFFMKRVITKNRFKQVNQMQTVYNQLYDDTDTDTVAGQSKASYQEVTDSVTSGTVKNWLSLMKAVIDKVDVQLINDSDPLKDVILRLQSMHETNVELMEAWLLYASNPYTYDRPQNTLDLVKPSEV